MREEGDATTGVYKVQKSDGLQHSIARAPKATIIMYKLVSTAVQQFVSHSVQIFRKLCTSGYDAMESGRGVFKLYAEYIAIIFRVNCAYFMGHHFRYIVNPSFAVFLWRSMKFTLTPTIAVLSIVSGDPQIFRKPSSHLKILVTRRAIISSCSTTLIGP